LPLFQTFLKTGEKVTRISGQEVTLLLQAWANGDHVALDALIPIVYDELRRMAHRQMSFERADHTLQSDALVNEVYLRLIGAKEVQWSDHAHFFAYAAQLMRRILVDHARSRCRMKRGGAVTKIALDSSIKIGSSADAGIARLDDALTALEKAYRRKAKVVELRFFGGFSIEEIAKALGISTSTVMNDWQFAKVWLLRELESSGKENEA
jgi:RNA polymerase sigma-70 factor, ECF subfamily